MRVDAIRYWTFLAFLLPVAGEDPAAALRIRVPAADWTLVVAAPGFEFSETESNADGTRFWAFGDREEPGIVLTVVIEKDEWAETPRECADEARISRNAEGLTRTDREEMTVTEYDIHTFQGNRIAQKHAFVHLFRGGYCIEAHLSILDYRTKRRSLIDEVLDSIRVVEAEDRTRNP